MVSISVSPSLSIMACATHFSGPSILANYFIFYYDYEFFRVFAHYVLRGNRDGEIEKGREGKRECKMQFDENVILSLN